MKKNIVAHYVYDKGEVVYMLCAVYNTEKDAETAAKMGGGVVMNKEEFERECTRLGLQ